MTVKKMGWFNTSYFTVVYDPPLSEMETQFKALIRDAAQLVAGIPIYNYSMERPITQLMITNYPPHRDSVDEDGRCGGSVACSERGHR